MWFQSLNEVSVLNHCLNGLEYKDLLWYLKRNPQFPLTSSFIYPHWPILIDQIFNNKNWQHLILITIFIDPRSDMGKPKANDQTQRTQISHNTLKNEKSLLKPLKTQFSYKNFHKMSHINNLMLFLPTWWVPFPSLISNKLFCILNLSGASLLFNTFVLEII